MDFPSGLNALGLRLQTLRFRQLFVDICTGCMLSSCFVLPAIFAVPFLLSILATSAVLVLPLSYSIDYRSGPLSSRNIAWLPPGPTRNSALSQGVHDTSRGADGLCRAPRACSFSMVIRAIPVPNSEYGCSCLRLKNTCGRGNASLERPCGLIPHFSMLPRTSGTQ